MNESPRKSTALVDFFDSGTTLTYDKGEIIIRPEDTPQGVLLITSGFVKSYDITKYGEENLLVIRKAGMIFPVLWTLRGERTSVFYQAMSEVTLKRVSIEDYNEKLEKDPKFARDVLDQVVTMYRVHSQRILNLEYRSAAERVAYRLITLADRFGHKSKGTIIIDAPIRHHDIAASVNCSRETASREMSKLEKKGLVGSKDGKIIIKDLDGLKSKIEQQRRIDKVLNLTKRK